MTKCNKQYIVVKSQYVLHILQYIAICFWHIVTALVNNTESFLYTVFCNVDIVECTIFIGKGITPKRHANICLLSLFFCFKYS